MFLEFFQGNSHLAKDFEEEWRTDLTTAVKGNGHGTTIRMVQTFVTANLPRMEKPELAEPPFGIRAL